MEATYPAKAIILKREPRGENDSRVFVYTRERGKLDLIARGTKKIKSKLAGHLEPICLSNIMVVKGKHYDYIGAAISENCFSNIKLDLDKLIQAGRAFNTVNSFVKEDLKDEEVFNLLTVYLGIINNNQLDLEKIKLLTDFFVLKLLALLGHKPELYICVVCKKNIVPGNNYFDLLKGGTICNNCITKEGDSNNMLTISDNCIKILRLAIIEDFYKLKTIKINNKLFKEVNKIISSFENYIN